MTKKPSDEQILFPDTEIAGIKVKPWSFGKLFDISDSLETVIDKLEERKLDEILIRPEVSLIDFAKLFIIAKKEVLRIISITVDKDEAELRNLSIEDGVKLGYAIFVQNRDSIKNAFGPLLHVLKAEEDESDDQKEQ